MREPIFGENVVVNGRIGKNGVNVVRSAMEEKVDHAKLGCILKEMVVLLNLKHVQLQEVLGIILGVMPFATMVGRQTLIPVSVSSGSMAPVVNFVSISILNKHNKN